jgi:chaperonin cofactor prefoldin
MAEPDNFILTLLREIRAEMNQRFQGLETGMNARFNSVDEQLDRVDKRIDSVKQAAFGESVLGRYAVAEVEDRLEKMEKRLRTLEQERG